MSLKSVSQYFPLILCFTACFLIVLPYISRGGASQATAIEAPDQFESEIIMTVLGEPSVPSFIAQPDLPLAFRPSGVPDVRPGRVPKHATFTVDTLLLDPLPQLVEQKEPARPPKLLPESVPEPGIVYVVPFTGVMVPDEVYDRIFDQFVDAMNQQSVSLGLQFVILKQGAERVGPDWLAVRKYITGEIYSYIEDSGALYTEIRTKARIAYYHPNQKTPAFATVLPLSTFFDRSQSDINIERIKLAESIVTTLTERLLPVFDKSLISEHSPQNRNNGV